VCVCVCVCVRLVTSCASSCAQVLESGHRLSEPEILGLGAVLQSVDEPLSTHVADLLRHFSSINRCACGGGALQHY